MDSEALLAELARYEAEIANIESRFIRITDKLFYVQREDDALVRQRVEQLIEILGLRGIEWAKLGYENARKLCIS